MESLERGPEIISINMKIFLEKYTNKVKCIWIHHAMAVIKEMYDFC